jgi:hypothetical protein
MSERKKLPFEIRDYVCCPEKDPVRVQRVYDCINRTIFLVGDIPFSQLFKMSLSDLSYNCESRIEELFDYGLLVGGNLLEVHLKIVRSEAVNTTITDILTRSVSQFSDSLINTISALHRIAFALPVPPRANQRILRRRVDTIENLISVAPWLTTKDLFTRPARHTPSDVVTAVQEARTTGVIALKANDRCCREGSVSGVADSCSPSTGNECYIRSDVQLCTLVSDRCVA